MILNLFYSNDQLISAEDRNILPALNNDENSNPRDPRRMCSELCNTKAIFYAESTINDENFRIDMDNHSFNLFNIGDDQNDGTYTNDTIKQIVKLQGTNLKF